MAKPKLEDGLIDITDQIIIPQTQQASTQDGLVDITDQIDGETPQPEEGGYDLLGGAKVLGGTLLRVPENIGAAAVQVVKGQSGATVVNRDKADDFVKWVDDRNKERQIALQKEYGESKVFPGVKVTDVGELAQNAGFSGIGMVTGLAAGVGATLLTKSPAAGWAAGAAASGTTAYRQVGNQFTTQYLEMKNEEKQQSAGQPLTLDEENILKKDFETKAMQYGLWEAVPEALGNVGELKVLITPLSRMFGKHLATKLMSKVFGLYGTELATEAVTQHGETNLEIEAGLNKTDTKRSFLSPTDIAKSAEEVYPQVFLLTTLMAGAGTVANKGYEGYTDRKRSALVQEAVANGAHTMLSDEQLSTVLKDAETFSIKRPGDTGLGRSILELKQEARNRMDQTSNPNESVTNNSAAADVPDFEPTPENKAVALDTFRNEINNKKLSLQDAITTKKRLEKSMPESADDLNKIIIEAEANKLFSQVVMPMETGQVVPPVGLPIAPPQGANLTFGENIAPYDYNKTWEDYYDANVQPIVDRNNAKITELKKKGSNKWAKEQIALLNGEISQAQGQAENAFFAAFDAYSKPIIERARQQGLIQNEEDETQLKDTIQELTDGHVHDNQRGTWDKVPLAEQALDEFRAWKEIAPEGEQKTIPKEIPKELSSTEKGGPIAIPGGQDYTVVMKEIDSRYPLKFQPNSDYDTAGPNGEAIDSQAYDNAHTDEMARVWGFEAPNVDEYGWSRYDFKNKETLKAPPNKKGYASLNDIDLDQAPNGKWSYGISFNLGTGGESFGSSVFDDIQYDNRDEALRGAISSIRKKIDKSLKEKNVTQAAKDEGKKLTKWLDSIAPTVASDNKIAGTGGKRGPANDRLHESEVDKVPTVPLAGNLSKLETENWKHGGARWEDKENRIEYELNAPETGANPSKYWEGGIRHKGWAQESVKFNTRDEVIQWLDNYDTNKIDKDAWGPGQQFIDEMFGKGSYERVIKDVTPDNESKIQAAIADAKKNGPSNEFRALFGGIDPKIAGTTNEAVSALAKELGLVYRDVKENQVIEEDDAAVAKENIENIADDFRAEVKDDGVPGGTRTPLAKKLYAAELKEASEKRDNLNALLDCLGGIAI